MSSARLGRTSGRDIAGGLPSGPRSRSVGRYETRERERVTEHDRRRERGGNNYDSYRGPPPPAERTRTVRSQRSISDMSSARSGRGGPATLYSDVPDVPPLPRSRRSGESSASSRSTSSSSASSTFMGRVKGGGGYASSRTSLEDDPEPRKETQRELGGWMRQRTAAVPEPEQVDDGDDEPQDQSGYGLSVWSRVATAANTLTVSVSKAWASNITTDSGEQTPPGEESRLTRAMKAYHLAKARDPTDLPPWLFEEYERRPLGRSSARTWQQEDSEPGIYEFHDDAAPPRGRGLRDIYDAAAATPSTPTPPRRERHEMSRGRQDDVDAGYPSKANDRLKALRDAKRNAVQRNASVTNVPNEEWSSVRKEYSGGSELDNRPGVGRAPSFPARARPAVGSGLPPRPGSRK